jgi:predicted nucleotidyltransferase
MQQVMENLKTISARLKSEYRADKVILYGSYARGDATEDSDIDLLIIAPTKERFYERMATVRRLIRDLRRGIPVAPLVLTMEEIENRKGRGDQFIKQILETGMEI